MKVATEKYRGTGISGNYADFAAALGGYGERITDPAEIVPAIRRGVAKTESGVPALLQFITSKGQRISRFFGVPILARLASGGGRQFRIQSHPCG